MLKFKRPKNKYMIEVTRGKGKGIDKDGKRLSIRYYQVERNEAMLDAYWALVFSHATRVRIRSAKDRRHKIYRTFNNLNDWEDTWNECFGPNSRYFVFKDRH